MDALLMNASTATSSKVLVEKRDGRVVDFDPINIISAVKSAFADLDKQVGPEEEKLIRGFADQIEGEITERYNGPAKIEDIQNLVEHALIDAHLYDVARAYTNYRLDKDIQRAKATDVNEAVSRFINQDPTLIHENANKDANVYATQRDLLAGAVSKAAAFNMLPPAVANAHMKGDIHFHDADYSPFTAQSNCSLPNFWDMLANGFTLGNAPMASPKSIAIATKQSKASPPPQPVRRPDRQPCRRAPRRLREEGLREVPRRGPRDHPRRHAGGVRPSSGRERQGQRARQAALRLPRAAAHGHAVPHRRRRAGAGA